jgi:RNA polymerase sigma factor (sigma-70 family)
MNVQDVTPTTERREGALRNAAKATLIEERLLVAQAKSGRSNAFGELYERHHLRAYRTAFRILHNGKDAEDAAQGSFQHAFTNLDKFREESAFSTWVTRIAINEALMLLRQRRITTPLSENNNDDAVAPSATPATSLFRLQHSPELFPSTPRRCPERIATCRTTRTTRRFAMFCLGVTLGEFQLPQLRGFCVSWSSRNHLGNKGKCRIRSQKATSRSDMSSVSLVFCWPIWAKWFRISGRCVMRLSPLRWTVEKTAETGRSTKHGDRASFLHQECSVFRHSKTKSARPRSCGVVSRLFF